MQMKSTLSFLLGTAAITGVLLLNVKQSQAQVIGCENGTVIWSNDFGTGTTPTSSPDVVNLIYQATGNLTNEGVYRITNNTQQKPEWLNSPDHTGNTNGQMLVANGQDEIFYQKTISSASGFGNGTYSFSLWAMNIDSMGVCSPNPLLTQIIISIEYLDESNQWQPLNGSPYTAAKLAQTTTPVWVNVGSEFTLTSSGTFKPLTLRITISDGVTGGCGNDFAADDFNLTLCPEGGPTPVTFEGITAKQQGSGVSVNWSTSQEINNDHFEVERSANGNTGWQTIGTVAGAGSSQLAHSYNVFDANPLSGINYYRVKQVDKDGNSSYSKTVSIRLDGVGTKVSVLANPFRGSLTIQFSGTSQQVNARLMDLTGRQVARESWNISNGASTQQFSNVSGLQNGIYILSIQSSTGELLFNGKVLKQ